MIEPTEEMNQAFWGALLGLTPEDCGAMTKSTRKALTAVLTLVERGQRARLADELEEHAADLWCTRRGEVGIEYVNGVEAAAHRLRSGGPS